MTESTAVRPEDVLADSADSATIGGVDVRKGTIAAFVANSQLLESLPSNDSRRAEIEEQLRALAPALHAVGLLDVFKPRSPLIAAIIAAAVPGR